MKYLLAALITLAPAAFAEELPPETENWSVIEEAAPIHDISHLAMPEHVTPTAAAPQLQVQPEEHVAHEHVEPYIVSETTVTTTVTEENTGTPIAPEQIVTTATSATTTVTEVVPGEPVSTTTVSTETVEATVATPPLEPVAPTPASTTIPSNHVAHTPACPQVQHHAPALKGVDNASTRTYLTGMNTMHKDMDITYTGDSDIDFLRGMIAHHQGAVSMARTVMEYGRDAQVRRLAKDVIRSQTAEIATMEKWLANLEKRGVRVSSDMPRSGQWTDENWVGEGWLNER